jgi:hypothetical protein
MKKSILFVAILALGFTACKKEETPDLTKPVISVTQPAADHMDLTQGATFTIQATLTDDVALSQWKFDIHSADGHTHRIMAGEWELTETGAAADKSYIFSKTLTVPADALLGDYHFTLEATDKAGNAAVPVILELHVE